jgi:hypothetical protein
MKERSEVSKRWQGNESKLQTEKRKMDEERKTCKKPNPENPETG